MKKAIVLMITRTKSQPKWIWTEVRYLVMIYCC